MDVLHDDDLSVEVEHSDGLLEEHGRMDREVNPIGRFTIDVTMVAAGSRVSCGVFPCCSSRAARTRYAVTSRSLVVATSVSTCLAHARAARRACWRTLESSSTT